MSALKPENEKYRSTWKVWGAQMIPSAKYKQNWENIKWGTSKADALEREELTSPSHYRLKIKTSGQ